MTQTEIVERFFSMERKLRELSGELIAKGMTVEETKKATEKDIKDFSDFAYNNSDAIYNAIKENLIERLKNDATKPIDALFIYLMVTNFTPINSLQSDHLSHSVTKTNDQVLANSAKTCKDEQNPTLPGFEEQEGVAGRDYIPVEWVEAIENYGKWKIVRVNEQNPAWSGEDETGLNDAMWAIEQARTTAKDENDMGNLWYAERWLKSLKSRVQPQPKSEWSEEDEATISRAISIINWAAYGNHSYTILNDEGATEVIERLKSLKERYTWKPSDEQMEMLNEVLNFAANHESPHWNDYIFGTLNSLIRQLKKLKG